MLHWGILVCTLLSWCKADLTFGATNSMLDPGRITWWRSKWTPAPITLSRNNRSSSAVSVTFYISPTTSLTAGVFEVTFPTSFTLAAGSNVSGQVLQVGPVTYSGGSDYAQVVTGITLPSTVGSYGPFALRTRYNSSGQQVDVNLNFGCVYVSGDAGSLGALTVTVVGAASTGTIINRSGLTLSFKFTIAMSLWRYDTFILTADSRWTIASGAACSSADYAGRYNNFNGTNSANPHSLQCVVTQLSTTTLAQQVFIYGLAVDGVDTASTTDNQYVDLRITSVISPNSVYPGSVYNWNVATNRFGTTTILETANYSAGPLVINDVITTVSWAPTWGSTASNLVNGQFVFMDLTFTLANAIPATTSPATSGYITITVTERLNDSTNPITNWATGMALTTNCYVVTFLDRSVDCTTPSTSSYLITGLPAVSAGTSIKIRSVVYMLTSNGSNVQVSSINTFQGVTGSASTGGYPIDIASNQGSFTLATSTSIVAATSFNWYHHAPTTTTLLTVAGGTFSSGAVGNNNLQFVINTPTISSSSSFTISCPFSSTVDDFSIALPSPAYNFESTGGSGVVGTVSGTLTTAPVFTVGTSGVSLGSITFTGANAAAGYSTHQRLEISKTGSGTNMQLPRVATNYATAYECRAAVVIGTVTYTGFTRLAVIPQPWDTVNFKLPCLDVANGVPAMIDINPNIPLATSSSTQTYYVEVEFAISSAMSAFTPAPAVVSATTRNHDPMNFAVDYPFAKPGAIPTSAKLYSTSSFTVVALTGFGALAYSASSVTSFYFPIGGFSAGAFSVSVRSLYYLTADPRYKFISHQSTTSSFIAASIANSWDTNAFVTSSGVNGNALTSLAINAFRAAAPGGQAWFYIVLPTGWTMPTTGTVKLLGTAIPTAYFFTSPIPSFNYPGVLFTNQLTSTPTYQATPIAADLTNGTIVITGLSIALGSNSNLSVRVAAGVIGSSCAANSQASSFASSAGAITNLSITPSSIKVRGPDGVNISHTVSFTLTHTIPLGGSINLSFNAGWTAGYTSTVCSGCSTTGLTAVTGAALSCVLSGTGVLVTGFAALTTASTTVTITLYGLLGPTSATSVSSPTPFLTALTSNIGATSSTAIIDQITDFTGSQITVTAGSTASVATWTARKTYPSTAGATYVDLYLKFSLTHALPACGNIAISSPLLFKSTLDIKNLCFFSPLQYSGCSVSGTTLTLTLAQAYTASSLLELYLDGMVDNPATIAATSTGFQATATWGSANVVIVDSDTGPVQSTQTYAASAVLSTIITGSATSAIAFTPKTSGEVATYVFDFKDTANFAVTDQYWIVFPSSYDYFLGDTWAWFSNEPNVYYIDCSSAQLGTTWCQVDHNILIVSGSNAIAGSTQIVVTINNIVNPIAGQTSAFQIYHVDTNGNFVTINQNYGTVTPTATALYNIGVRSLVLGESRLFRNGDYTWRLYIADTMNTDSQLQVLFPKEYNLRLFDKKDTYSCSTTWLDISTSATIKTQQNWNSASSCTASGNLVSLTPPTTSTAFTISNIVTFTLQAVGNPQFGQSRTASATTTDFDVTDSILWPLYAYWTSKFTFFVYRNSATSLAYTSRSYPNMNAAYANFYDGYRPILVNGYIPQSRASRILVYAGTQTNDVFIATESTGKPMAAKQVVFTPITNSRTPDGGKLKFTSVQSNWTLFQSFYSIQFRVCAAIDTTKGLYYIDWSNNETKQTGLNDVQYNIPASTLVEVVGKTSGKYTFGIATIPNVPIGFTSVPIKVSISNAPCTDVVVSVAVSGIPANISVTPSSLSFAQDVNVRYFQIQVASNYDLTLGTVQTLLFTLTGTDAYTYAIAASTKFTITQATTTQTPGSIVSWGPGQPTKTTITVSPTSDQIGVIYYQLAAAGSIVPSFSTLKSSVTALVNQNGTTGGDGKDSGANSQSDPDTGETWEDFQRRLYKLHLQTKWTGSISMYATTAVASLSFTWLWAASVYQISGYLDNLSTASTTPTVRTETFTTLAMADCQPFSLKFTGQVPQTFSDRIANIYAGVIGVNPTRLFNPTYATSTSRVLQGTGTTVAYTTFTYTLLVNRFSESPSPTDQAKVTGSTLTALSSALANEGLTNTLNSVTNNAIPTRTAPVWTVAPGTGSSTVSSVTASMRASVAGRTCCVALTGSSIVPTAEQVMLGLDAVNSVANGVCMNTDLVLSSNSIQITSLQASTSYYVYCTATDSYPLWPTYMTYSTNAPLTPVPITTLNSAVIDASGASYLGGLLALLVLFH